MLLNIVCNRFYGGNNTFYHTLPEDSTSYFVVTKETYEYGGLFDLSFEPVDCPGLDSCSEAGVISGLPFVSTLDFPSHTVEVVVFAHFPVVGVYRLLSSPMYLRFPNLLDHLPAAAVFRSTAEHNGTTSPPL